MAKHSIVEFVHMSHQRKKRIESREKKTIRFVNKKSLSILNLNKYARTHTINRIHSH